MTVLDRLAKKGFARRERDGRAWQYRPAATREAYVAELMLTALDQTGDRDAALARFAQSVTGAEAVVLLEALARLEREQASARLKETAGLRYGGTGRRGTACRGRRRERAMRERAVARIVAAQVSGGRDLVVAGARPGGRSGGGRRAARGWVDAAPGTQRPEC